MLVHIFSFVRWKEFKYEFEIKSDLFNGIYYTYDLYVVFTTR
jgi:hypothetical protein